MKTLLYSFTFFLLLFVAIPAHAEGWEDLAPGYLSCVKKAESTDDYVECGNKAHDYWDGILLKNYKDAMKFCDSEENPIQDPPECKKRIKSAMKAWSQYKESMYPAMFAVGSGGTMDRITIGVFMVKVVRAQAEAMDHSKY